MHDLSDDYKSEPIDAWKYLLVEDLNGTVGVKIVGIDNVDNAASQNLFKEKVFKCMKHS